MTGKELSSGFWQKIATNRNVLETFWDFSKLHIKYLYAAHQKHIKNIHVYLERYIKQKNTYMVGKQLTHGKLAIWFCMHDENIW